MNLFVQTLSLRNLMWEKDKAGMEYILSNANTVSTVWIGLILVGKVRMWGEQVGGTPWFIPDRGEIVDCSITTRGAASLCGNSEMHATLAFDGGQESCRRMEKYIDDELKETKTF